MSSCAANTSTPDLPPSEVIHGGDRQANSALYRIALCRLRWDLWVPNRSSMSGDQGIFMYQPTESVAASEVQAGL